MINRDAPYVQIIEHYRQEIRDGQLKDGDMLPSGREIAQQFGVSLATAAKSPPDCKHSGWSPPGQGLGRWSPRRGRPPTGRMVGRC